MKRILKYIFLLIFSVLLLSMLTGCTITKAEPTPVPTPSNIPSSTAAPDYDIGKLRISEVMAKNRSTLVSSSGIAPDWIELENCSDEAVDVGGWSLSDDSTDTGWALPSSSLNPGELLVIYVSSDIADGDASEAGFSLSQGESVCLFTPAGSLSSEVECTSDESDVSVSLGEDGGYFETVWATPGYPNTDDGYAAFCASRDSASDLIISEVMVSNISYMKQRGVGCSDWVELKNVSSEPIDLSEYFLSDDNSDYLLWQLPEQKLLPGKTVLLYCSGDESQTSGAFIHTNFSLSAEHEQLFLSSRSGLIDYVNLHDVPVNGSFGRLDGENGFFYFTAPTPGTDNTADGYRSVTAKPSAEDADGVFNDVKSVSVKLSGEGSIYYTLDGSVPTVKSAPYTAPISLPRTTVVRAVSIADGKAPSRVLTLTYIINEEHTLPVISLVTDDVANFNYMYKNGYKGIEIPGTFSLYEDDSSFTNACGIKMSGAGSLELPKKSMSVMFRGKYGDGDVNYDVFDSGVSTYGSLTMRVGETYPTTIIKSDLFQDLALEMSDEVLAQHSKYCVLYVNGNYQGIHCLKEKFGQDYYANLKDVSKDSVTVLKYPVAPASSFYTEVIQYCLDNDLSLDANYEHLCSVLNIDSFIDWFLIEGLSGNRDIGGNLRVFKSTEDGGRWSLALYDLDWAFTEANLIFDNTLYTSYYQSGQSSAILEAAFKNEEFVDKLLMRYAEVYDTVLSNEHIISLIDEREELLQPEIARERALWGSSEEAWHARLEDMRSFITKNDLQNKGVDRLCAILGLTDAQKAKYFS